MPINNNSFPYVSPNLDNLYNILNPIIDVEQNTIQKTLDKNNKNYLQSQGELDPGYYALTIKKEDKTTDIIMGYVGFSYTDDVLCTIQSYDNLGGFSPIMIINGSSVLSDCKINQTLCIEFGKHKKAITRMIKSYCKKNKIRFIDSKFITGLNDMFDKRNIIGKLYNIDFIEDI